MNWNPIESAPKDGSRILLCMPGSTDLYYVVSWADEHEYWESDTPGADVVTEAAIESCNLRPMWTPISPPPTSLCYVDTKDITTKFNPEGKASLTYGESLGPAMNITDQADADQYFTDYVKFLEVVLARHPLNDGKTAEEIARINLGYYAGYYPENIRERVERLFRCHHPILGKIRP